MRRKFILIILIVIIVLLLAGVYMINRVFDTFSQEGYIEEFAKDILNENPKMMDEAIGQQIGKRNAEGTLPSDSITQDRQSVNKNGKGISNAKNESNQMKSVENKASKSSRSSVKIEPADKARVISIITSNLTASDIAELKKLAAARPITSEKKQRAKAIVESRLSAAEKQELKALFVKYYVTEK